MKKIVSVVLAFLIVMGCISVSASTDISLDFLKAGCTSAKSEGTISFKLNKPLDILDYMQDEYYSGISMKALFESLLNSEIKVSQKSQYKNEGKTFKTESHMMMNVPIVLNEYFDSQTNIRMSFWCDFDLSDIAQPKMTFVAKIPFDSRYITFDMSKMADESSLDSVMKYLPGSDSYNQFEDDIIDLIANNCTAKKSGNKVYITISNENIIKIILEIAKNVPEFNENPEDLEKELSQIQIFDDNAIVMEFEFDYMGRIKNSKTDLNIKTNIYDIMAMSGEDVEGIDREKSYVDITMTVDEKFNYNNATVNFPVLTEENSYDPYYYEYPEDEYIEDEYFEDTEYIWCDIYADDKNEYINMLDKEKYPLRKVIEGTYYNNDYITNAKFELSNGQIIITDENLGFNMIVTEFSNKVIFNGKEIYLDTPVYEENGTCYVTKEFIEKVYNIQFYSATYYSENHAEISFY